MRRFLIRVLFPFCFCMIPLLGGALVAVALPYDAVHFYINHLAGLDILILGLGTMMFVGQTILCWRALQLHGSTFDERPDPWIANLAQTAEWFPMLGLLATVAGILQTFSGIKGNVPQEYIIQQYAPAVTGTGTGLFMALVNILPPWVVNLGRKVILSLAGVPSTSRGGMS